MHTKKLISKTRKFLRSKPPPIKILKFNFSYLFPSDKFRSFEDSIRNVSITLINDHFSDGHPRPLVPASIEIRGIQVKENVEKLPEVRNLFFHKNFNIFFL